MGVVAAAYRAYSPDWWTPPEWLEWARLTLGGDYHDPCPRDWSVLDPCGLLSEWPAKPVYCNHPGSRRTAEKQRWWDKCVKHGEDFVWCAFNVEQLRHLRPSPFCLPGWLVMPRKRLAFIWGGEDEWRGTRRMHMAPARSPSNWSVFWTSRLPHPELPGESVISKTGEGAWES